MDNFYDKVKIIDRTINSAGESPCQSSCVTCKNSHLGCCEDDSKEDDNFEYHLVDVDMSTDFPHKMKAYSVLDTRNSFDKCLDKITDGFICVCVLFMQTFEKCYDKIVDSFKKAYREGKI